MEIPEGLRMHVYERFVEGAAAYRAEDYATAAEKLLPLAAAGHRDAQSIVAEMYRYMQTKELDCQCVEIKEFEQSLGEGGEGE